MNKVIKLNTFSTDHRLYDDKAKEVLSNMPHEVRDLVREAMESSTSKYIEVLSKPVEIQIPESITEEQKNSIVGAIQSHHDICKSLINDLAITSAKLAVAKHKNS